ncbi:hypothetical protein B0T18DRAFT_489003 [Schizothecium vesticola]|uniref:Uncharacterized protein n=1 Tax=Schizothecium vesticola TaxID=314040 RepID=A0AA40EVQ0_9PEZI|nr:hypothetical protein B0T18DRAFT_489003 [Schizothecium vesticola]
MAEYDVGEPDDLTNSGSRVWTKQTGRTTANPKSADIADEPNGSFGWAWLDPTIRAVNSVNSVQDSGLRSVSLAGPSRRCGGFHCVPFIANLKPLNSPITCEVPHGDDAGEARARDVRQARWPCGSWEAYVVANVGPPDATWPAMRSRQAMDASAVWLSKQPGPYLPQGYWHCLPLTISRNGEMRDSTCRISLGLAEEPIKPYSTCIGRILAQPVCRQSGGGDSSRTPSQVGLILG